MFGRNKEIEIVDSVNRAMEFQRQALEVYFGKRFRFVGTTKITATKIKETFGSPNIGAIPVALRETRTISFTTTIVPQRGEEQLILYARLDMAKNLITNGEWVACRSEFSTNELDGTGDNTRNWYIAHWGKRDVDDQHYVRVTFKYGSGKRENSWHAGHDASDKVMIPLYTRF